jgi:hypothetical protein
MSEVADFCKKHAACSDGREWAKQYTTMADVWANCKNPDWMLWIMGRAKLGTPRLWRLFACWCVRNTPLADGRKVWDLLTDHCSRNAVEVAERHAWGKATDEELAAAWAAASPAAGAAAWAAARDAARAAARAAQCNGIRLVFGNPFSPNGMEPYTDGSRAFRLRKAISTSDYDFHAGKYVRGSIEPGRRTYRIWPPGQEFAFIVGVYRRELRPVANNQHGR